MYPFDDRVPIGERLRSQAIRQESRAFCGDVKHLSYVAARQRAKALLNRWGGTVGDEPFYRVKYGTLADGGYISLAGNIEVGDAPAS